MVDIIRTDDTHFENIKDWSYEPKYTEVNSEYGNIRIHYIDEGSENSDIVLLIHGEPSWGYLYRKMIDPLVNSGKRVIVPDLPGFGRSDKLTERNAYTYEKYVCLLYTSPSPRDRG